MLQRLQSIPAISCSYMLVHVISQQCPNGWYGYSLQGKCYKFNTANKLTWQDARVFCQTHQGDLLRVDTANELRWVLNQIRSNYRQHAHYNGTVWTGLNNREYLTAWEWADGTPAGNFIPWNPNEPNNYRGREGCAGIVASGKFNDDQCSNKYPFVCSRDRGKLLNI
ncbi:chromatin-modulating protein mrc1 [Mactra antiquata]